MTETKKTFVEAIKHEKTETVNSSSELLDKMQERFMEAEADKNRTERERINSINQIVTDDYAKTKTEIPVKHHSSNILSTTTLFRLSENPCPLTNQRILEWTAKNDPVNVEEVIDEEGDIIGHKLSKDALNEIICSPAFKEWADEMITSYRAKNWQSMQGFMKTLQTHLAKQDWEEIARKNEARAGMRGFGRDDRRV